MNSTLEKYSPVLLSLGPEQSIPLFQEHVKAGFPSPAESYTESKLDLNSIAIKNPSATYFLRVSGVSMINAGISPNDLIIIDRSIPVSNNDIIVAAINGQFTVKRLVYEKGKPVLKPENPDFEPIYPRENDEMLIYGVVIGLYRGFK